MLGDGWEIRARFARDRARSRGGRNLRGERVPRGAAQPAAERIEEELSRDLPTRVVSSVSGETVLVEALAEHERTWVDPRGGLKYTLEDLRPIPEFTEHERALAMARPLPIGESP